MAWVNITNLTGWQYNNSPSDPGASSPYRALWLKQTSGIRTDGTHQVYTEVRKSTDTSRTRGEISKTYWDAR